jgi:hypothetical protein
MPKSRGRKRHGRSTRKTRREWKKRRPCTRRMRGGRSDDPTVRTVEGMPVTEKALVSIPGKGIYDIKAFKQHEKDMDFQGPGATGYN